ncbi:MAG: cobalamin biosynthesis protein CbiN [Methanospirillum sp.]|nr:cobalamin biosynthesis protein CbiN [Methanospirillum sp.]
MISKTVFLAVGVVLALVVAVSAVFLASGDPDGLDSTALVTQGQKELTLPAGPDAELDESVFPGEFEYEAPFPDYTIEGADDLTNVGLMVGGVLLALVAVFGVGYLVTGIRRSGSL